MLELKKILVPTDFSEFSKHSVNYAYQFAKRFDAELHLLNVVEDIYPIVPEPGTPAPISGEYLSGLKESSERMIQQFPTEDWASDLSVVRSVISGTPFLEIIRYARTEKIDMIVIGTHGRSGLIHALMGSVVEKVVRKSPCPVLTVRPEGHDFVMP
jgi:universal stress protein A